LLADYVAMVGGNKIQLNKNTKANLEEMPDAGKCCSAK
jgi:hypothetical protein